MSDNDLRQPPEDLLMSAVGAALFASEEPVSPAELSQAFGKIETARIGFLLLPVDFRPELVGRDKGYLHAREKGRKQNGNQYEDDQV